MPNRRRAVLQAQATYYIASGLWPLLSRRTFEAVTGPKTDWWLVEMVGLLAVTVGSALAVGAGDERPARAVSTLAALAALSFAGVDVVHSLRGRISKIYLADAGVEVGLLLALLR